MPMLTYTTVIDVGATGSASCILQGSLDGTASSWTTIHTVTQTGGGGSAATASSTTGKPFTWIRHNVNPNTSLGSTVRTIAVPYQDIMKTLFVIIFLLISSIVQANIYTIKWDVSPGATAYSVYTTSDAGLTWTKLRDVTAPTTNIITPTDAPDNALVLIRVSAKNAADETIRKDSGIWINTKWSPLQITGVGIQ